jgi:hypothetical protein
MKPSTTNFRRFLRNATLGLGLAAVIGGASLAPAMAADYRHDDRRDAREHVSRERDYRDHDYREHDYRDHDYRDHDYRDHDRYAYAAPVYRYAPAPAYVSPWFNFGFTVR